MALAGQHHVEEARQAHPYRPLGFPRAQSRNGCVRIGLYFFPAECSAHAQAFHRNLVASNP